MKKVIKAFPALLLASISVASYGAETNSVKITKTKVNSSQVYIYVNGMNDNNNCGNSSFVRMYWSLENVDRYWSMILAAQMAGKKVSFDGTCANGYLSVSSITVES